MLFRGIPGLDDVKDFTMLNRYMKVQLMPDSSYQKAMQARSMSSTSVNKVVRTASDEPPAYTIEPHNEYHTVDFPTKLLLFCQDPPSKGGEWLLSDGRAIFQQIHPDVVARFEEKQACYRVFYESYAENNRYTNWQTNIAPTKPEVEEYLTSKGYQWEWGEDDSLTYWKNFPAVVPHPVTGERCWFNQIHAHHKTFYTNHPFFRGRARAGWALASPLHLRRRHGDRAGGLGAPPRGHLGQHGGHCTTARRRIGRRQFSHEARTHGLPRGRGSQGLRLLRVQLSSSLEPATNGMEYQGLL
jgi:hypothetical protein